MLRLEARLGFDKLLPLRGDQPFRFGQLLGLLLELFVPLNKGSFLIRGQPARLARFVFQSSESIASLGLSARLFIKFALTDRKLLGPSAQLFLSRLADFLRLLDRRLALPDSISIGFEPT